MTNLSLRRAYIPRRRTSSRFPSLICSLGNFAEIVMIIMVHLQARSDKIFKSIKPP